MPIKSTIRNPVLIIQRSKSKLATLFLWISDEIYKLGHKLKKL